MEQGSDMLWLAALMGRLAACAFSFLIFLAVRRPRITDAPDPDVATGLTDDFAMANALAPAAPQATSEADSPASATSAVDDPATDLEAAEPDDEPDLASVATDPALCCEADADEEMTGLRDPDDAAEPERPSRTASTQNAEDWFATDNGAPEFDDFDPQEDDLVVVWDDATGPEPSIEIRRRQDDPAIAQVLMGDVVVAQFRTPSSEDHGHVSLMPLSLARSLGWACA